MLQVYACSTHAVYVQQYTIKHCNITAIIILQSCLEILLLLDVPLSRQFLNNGRSGALILQISGLYLENLRYIPSNVALEFCMQLDVYRPILSR